MADGRRRCALCDRPLGDKSCPHPWELPFYQWPRALRDELQAALPRERHPGS